MEELTHYEMSFIALLIKDLNKEERTFAVTSAIYQIAQCKKLIKLVAKNVNK